MQAIAYALTALFIRRRFLPKARKSITWGVLAAIIAATFVLPVIGALTTPRMSAYPTQRLGAWYVASPVGLTNPYEEYRATTIAVAAAWAAVMFVYNLSWLTERMRAFGRYKPANDRAPVEAAREAAADAGSPDASPS